MREAGLDHAQPSELSLRLKVAMMCANGRVNLMLDLLRAHRVTQSGIQLTEHLLQCGWGMSGVVTRSGQNEKPVPQLKFGVLERVLLMFIHPIDLQLGSFP